MALIAAAGAVARGDDGGAASGAGGHLAEAECLVGEVAVAVPGQPRLLGEDEPERADSGEVAGELGFESGGVAGLLGGGPYGEELLDSLHPAISYRSAEDAARAVGHGPAPAAPLLFGGFSFVYTQLGTVAECSSIS